MPHEQITSKTLIDLNSQRLKKGDLIQENNFYVAGKNPPTLNADPEKKPDNRITIPFAKMAVETLSGYAGRSGDIQEHWENVKTEESEVNNPGDDEYIKLRKEIAENNDTDLETSELYETALTQGVSYELFWVTGADEESETVAEVEYKIIPNQQIMLVWSRDIKPELLYFVWYKSFKEGEQKKQSADVYYPEFSEHWERLEGGTFTRDKENDTVYPYKSVPLAIYPINRTKMSVFEAEKGLIEGNDKLLNKSLNEVDRFNALIALFPGLVNKDFRDKLIEIGVIDDLDQFEKWPTYLQKDLNGINEFYTMVANRLEKLFHKSIKIPDFSDENFVTAQSGLAMAYKLLAIEFRASTIDMYFHKGLKKRNELINDVLAESGVSTEEYKQIIKNVRNIPVDRAAAVEMAVKLNGILSKETLLRMLGKEIVEDVEKELARLEAQPVEVDLDNVPALTIDEG